MSVCEEARHRAYQRRYAAVAAVALYSFSLLSSQAHSALSGSYWFVAPSDRPASRWPRPRHPSVWLLRTPVPRRVCWFGSLRSAYAAGGTTSSSMVHLTSDAYTRYWPKPIKWARAETRTCAASECLRGLVQGDPDGV